MCPSGSKPFGKSESSTNSGNVRSSSRDKVNRVPLRAFSLHPDIHSPTPWPNSPQVKRDMRLAIHIYRPAQ